MVSLNKSVWMSSFMLVRHISRWIGRLHVEGLVFYPHVKAVRMYWNLQCHNLMDIMHLILQYWHSHLQSFHYLSSNRMLLELYSFTVCLLSLLELCLFLFLMFFPKSFGWVSLALWWFVQGPLLWYSHQWYTFLDPYCNNFLVDNSPAFSGLYFHLYLFSLFPLLSDVLGMLSILLY